MKKTRNLFPLPFVRLPHAIKLSSFPPKKMFYPTLQAIINILAPLQTLKWSPYCKKGHSISLCGKYKRLDADTQQSTNACENAVHRTQTRELLETSSH